MTWIGEVLLCVFAFGAGVGVGIALAPWIIRKIIRALLWDEVSEYQYHRFP